MTRVVCYVGLPGSGKSYIAREHFMALGDQGCLFDDIQSLDVLPENGEYEEIGITDPNFCFSSVRARADEILSEKYDNIEWIFFENAPEKCLKNVSWRNDGRKVDKFILNVSKEYFIPSNIVPLEIWQPK